MPRRTSRPGSTTGDFTEDTEKEKRPPSLMEARTEDIEDLVESRGKKVVTQTSVMRNDVMLSMMREFQSQLLESVKDNQEEMRQGFKRVERSLILSNLIVLAVVLALAGVTGVYINAKVPLLGEISSSPTGVVSHK